MAIVRQGALTCLDGLSRGRNQRHQCLMPLKDFNTSNGGEFFKGASHRRLTDRVMRAGAMCLALGTLLSGGCRTMKQNETRQAEGAVHFVGVTNVGDWVAGAVAEEWVATLPVVEAPMEWEELVVSWNVVLPPGAGLKVEARAVYVDEVSAFYTMGWWAEQAGPQRRESVTGQRDENGDVRTDTLVLRRPARGAEVRLTLLAGEGDGMGRVKWVGLSFWSGARNESGKDGGDSLATDRGTRATQVIDVPELSQLAYTGGRDWCSPTCVSMVMAYWAAKLGRSEWSNDVPRVAEAVQDRNWPGTGNWPFNTAYAGKFDGMRAYVTRLSGMEDLESWIAAGVPVVASVSADRLNGRSPVTPGDGHLVVVVGLLRDGRCVGERSLV